MDKEPIRIEIVAAADRDAIERLYRQAGWWSESDSTQDGNAWIDALVRGSFLFAGAFAGREMVGMGRSLSDGVSDAYIQDVTVLPAFRGRGIGAALIRRLCRELRRRGIGWVGLVAEPGTRDFYRRLGFSEMEGHLPMRLTASGEGE